MPKIAVIYYSATGTNHTIAQAVAEGATGAGAETRVRLIAETAPAAAIDSNPKWRAFVDKTANEPKASLDDLDWADGIVFGVPTRFGSPAAQFKQFIDTAGGLWFQGKLADKVYAAFTSAQNAHGGQEATLLSLYTTIHHFGGIIATPGYTDKVVFASGGNPYGVSVTANDTGATEADIAHAKYMGQRVATIAKKLRG